MNDSAITNTHTSSAHAPSLARHLSKCESISDTQNEQDDGKDLTLIGTTSTEESNEAPELCEALQQQQQTTVTHNPAISMVRGVKEKLIINKIGRKRGGAEWEKYIDGSVTDKHLGIKASELLWYLPPVQRQRWFDNLVLPQIDAGDVFFDLIYAGAANNLGGVLDSIKVNKDETLRIFIHFFGSLGVLWMCWELQTLYEGRYLTYDYFHRLVGIIRHLCIGFAIFNIAPLSYTDPRIGNVMVFNLAMLLEFMLSMGLQLELYYRGLGDRTSITNQTRDDFTFRNGALLVFYSAAFIISAVQVVHANRVDYQIESRPIWDAYDLPMTLNTIAYLSRFILSWVRILRKDERDVRDLYVPTNIEYLIDRYSGFIMVLMGVGVLSLLTPVDEARSSEHYLTVLCGMLTMIFLHLLKTEAECNSTNHALRRGPIPSELYTMLVHILTISLIGFGVSYFVFVEETFTIASDEDGTVEYLDLARYPFLPIIIISIELMTVTHCGLQEVIGHLFRLHEGKRKLNWLVVFVTLLKLGIILFSAITPNTWTNDPEVLAACGFGVVFSMFVTNLLSSAFIEKATSNEDIRNSEMHEDEVVHSTADSQLSTEARCHVPLVLHSQLDRRGLRSPLHAIHPLAKSF